MMAPMGGYIAPMGLAATSLSTPGSVNVSGQVNLTPQLLLQVTKGASTSGTPGAGASTPGTPGSPGAGASTTGATGAPGAAPGTPATGTATTIWNLQFHSNY